jgi:DNA modification methylase
VAADTRPIGHAWSRAAVASSRFTTGASDEIQSKGPKGIHVHFEEWTRLRTPVVLGTNAGAQPLAFQNWRRFKEAFPPELVARGVTETTAALGRQVLTCIDPFAGSGTTPLACQFLGITPMAIEVNPYLADLIEAKLTPVDGQLVGMRLAEVLATARSVDPVSYYSGGPPTFVEPGVKGRYLFSAEVANRLASLVDAVLRIREESVRRLLRVLLGSAALEVCNATVSGKGRRYRGGWEERSVRPGDLDRHFVSAVEAAVFDATRYARRRSLEFKLIRGDARVEVKTVDEVDLAIFSPPYPNSFDYTDVYNIELWALRYLRSPDENVKLRHSTLRSHVQIKRDMSSIALTPLVMSAIERLRSAPNLWDRAIPDMVGAYFDDLRCVMVELRRMLPRHGRVYIVVGDSRYSGVNIPVAAGLAQMVPELGYQVLGVEPFRSMRASPQQGGRHQLIESLIILCAN